MQDNKDISETWHNHWHHHLLISESELPHYEGYQVEPLLGSYGDEENSDKRYIVYLPTPQQPTDSQDD